MQSLPMIFMLVALVAMWFFMSRSQKKQQQERKNLLENMKPGDRVVTIGGLHGVLSEVNTNKSTVIIDCEGIFLEFDRAAIRTVTPGTGASVETEIEPADVADDTEADDTKE
jgi:preprotein translocase subunit YajC